MSKKGQDLKEHRTMRNMANRDRTRQDEMQ